MIHDEANADNRECDAECSTPKSEESKLKIDLVCPPAPRKPRPLKRKLEVPIKGFYPVPADLASVFLPLCFRPNKRIRALDFGEL